MQVLPWQSKSTEDMEKKITRITIPDRYNVIAEYNIGVLKQSEHPAQAKEFINLVKSNEGIAILEKYGFNCTKCDELREGCKEVNAA